MKKNIFLCLALFFGAVAFAAQPFFFGQNGVATGGGGGYTLVVDSTGGSATSFFPFGSDPVGGKRYCGLGLWSDASARTIGKISFELGLGGGSITGKTYTCKIWSMTGNNLNAVLATSAGVTGSNAWSGTLVDFIFTPYTTTGSTNYAITVDCGSDDATNYAQVYWNNTDTISGNLATFENTLARNDDYPAYDVRLKIYTSP